MLSNQAINNDEKSKRIFMTNSEKAFERNQQLLSELNELKEIVNKKGNKKFATEFNDLKVRRQMF